MRSKAKTVQRYPEKPESAARLTPLEYEVAFWMGEAPEVEKYRPESGCLSRRFFSLSRAPCAIPDAEPTRNWRLFLNLTGSGSMLRAIHDGKRLTAGGCCAAARM